MRKVAPLPVLFFSDTGLPALAGLLPQDGSVPLVFGLDAALFLTIQPKPKNLSLWFARDLCLYSLYSLYFCSGSVEALVAAHFAPKPTSLRLNPLSLTGELNST